MKLRSQLTHSGVSSKQALGFTLIEILVVIAVFSTATLIALDLFFTVSRVERKSVSTQRIAADARFTIEAIARDARNGAVDYDFYHNPPVGSREDPDPDGDGTATAEWTFSWGNRNVATLALRDQDGLQVIYRRKPPDPGIPNDRSVIEVSNDGGTSWQDITPLQVTVQEFDVYVNPDSDPYLIPQPDTRQGQVSDDCRNTAPSGFSEKDGVCLCPVTQTICWDGQTCSAVEICENPTEQPKVTIVLVTKGAGASQEEQGTNYLQTTVSSRRYVR